MYAVSIKLVPLIPSQTVPNVLDGREVLVVRPDRLHQGFQLLREALPVCRL